MRTPERAAALLQRLGLEAPGLTVSVVGTNGKGSVSSMIAAGLAAGGHTAGLFTSPHVESFLERISVNGAHITEEAVTAFVTQAQRLATLGAAPEHRTLRPAFFEYTLALALHEYARRRATAAVLEAGVGGGSDATRAVEGVSLTVITNVDLDHTDTLGTTLEQIVADKAGAIRPGKPVVSGVAQAGPRAVVRQMAERSGAPLHQYVHGARSQPLFGLPRSLTQLLKAYPTREMNARLAAAALRLLGLDESAVMAGLRTPPLPARGERFLVDHGGRAEGEAIDVVLDGAHDPAAAARLVAEVGGTEGRSRPYALLFGALGRKQGAAVLQVLSEAAHTVVVTEASAGDGVLPGPEGAVTLLDPEQALDAALTAASRAGAAGERPLVVVAGSLYLAGRIRPLLRARGRRIQAAWELPTH